MKPLFIDVEASGLGRGSYPIEVGIALGCGSTACMIIKPEPEWQYWDQRAEDLHGISRNTLESFGRAPIDVANYLNQLLAEQVLYSDAWGNDSCWLALLFEAANITQQFKLDSLRSLLTDEQAAVWHRVKETIIHNHSFIRHRASNDALILQRTYSHIIDSINSKAAE